MNWPWVSRAALDDALTQRDYWHRVASDAATKNDALTERLLSLKMAGAFEIPTIAISPEALARIPLQDHDEMRDLIDQACGSNLAKRRMMLRQLAVDRADRLEDDTIRERIVSGVQSEGVAG